LDLGPLKLCSHPAGILPLVGRTPQWAAPTTFG